ncbi:TRAP transporter large permease [Pararhodobacter aggregans]|uniref:TRAP transporter large permease protein n=1 Tax=Pararhodobacter aggregans TaxID=404875 RepID=A0A2T7UK78_9RHOB|nr:TRAP transporter large permease [Pararhodobacter aggregans]PTX03265.1 tripartite ATP-independent transporter DctM subunit [Pararhodobacter aggregans]PVE45059.1 C4-dicarboxylate ABC transporter permease [Pararhodobacter aggregans]
MPEWIFALVLMLGGIVALLMLGLPIVFAFIAVNIAGAWLFLGGDIGLMQMLRNMRSPAAQYSLAPIPLFVLMGEIMLHSGLAQRAIDAIDRLISRVPGRLSIVAVLSGTLFSSLSGSTIANAGVLGKSLYPQMKARGYHDSMAVGPILAVGGIAMLIPPSGLAVMLGSLASISINDLLIAGIVPAIMMAVLFLGYVMLRCRLDPSLAPVYETETMTLGERLRPVLVNVLPLALIFVCVVGSMFAGIATATESAALGVVATVIAAVIYRRFSLTMLVHSLKETLIFSAMILVIICTSGTFSQVLAFTGATQEISRLVVDSGIGPLMLLLGMLAVLVFLGCFMDQVSMMMLTLPIFMPIVGAAGIDPLWFGVLVLIALEISLITPPFGLLLFVMQGVAGPKLRVTAVYKAVLPFLALEFLVMGLLILFPGLVSLLPELMK